MQPRKKSAVLQPPLLHTESRMKESAPAAGPTATPAAPVNAVTRAACPHCSAQDAAGGGEGDLPGDLLDFNPVPRKVKRPDGWNAERQRAFIAHLARTGSPSRAAQAMGKNVSGIEAVFRSPGAESFRAAWDRALEIGRARTAREAEPFAPGRPPGIGRGKAAFAASGGSGDGGGRDGAGEWTDDDEKDNVALKLEIAERLAIKFLAKVQAEREARLAGQVVAADFYLRQITALEVALDLLAQDCGYSGFALLTQCRRGGHNLFAIAETPFSRMLDEERRRMWAEAGEPERPEHPPQKYLEHRAEPGSGRGYSLEPAETLGPASAPPPGVREEVWARMGYDVQKAMWAEQHRRDAEEQIEWESRSCRD